MHVGIPSTNASALLTCLYVCPAAPRAVMRSEAASWGVLSFGAAGRHVADHSNAASLTSLTLTLTLTLALRQNSQCVAFKFMIGEWYLNVPPALVGAAPGVAFKNSATLGSRIIQARLPPQEIEVVLWDTDEDM